MSVPNINAIYFVLKSWDEKSLGELIYGFIFVFIDKLGF